MTGLPMLPAAGDQLVGLRMWLRVPSFTFATVGLAVAAHLGAGGVVPGPAVLTVLVLGVVAVSAVTAAGEQRFPAIAAGTAAVQLGAHVALSTPALDGSLPGETTWTAGGSLAMTNHPMGVSSPTMTIGHVLAALALAWWLSRGEAATWRVIRWFVARLLRLGPVCSLAGPLAQPCVVALQMVRRCRIDGVPSRRGPPRAA